MSKHLLTPGRLTWGACRKLGKKIRSEDAVECLLAGFTPEMAMFSGLSSGEAWTALNGKSIVGAFGWTGEGRIWSLWAPTSKAESLSILHQTPEWVTGMVRRSGRPMLDNHVHVLNRKAINWLRASRCFVVEDAPVWVGAGYHLPFRTRADLIRKHRPAAALYKESEVVCALL